jgi:PTS system ascorbate-specific IIA component
LVPRVAVLLLTHTPLASALIGCAKHVYACAPEALGVLDFMDIEPNADVEATVASARDKLAHLEHGRGVLVLTDIFGATPANVAQRLAVPGQCEVIAGVNLPMLLRTLCYCDQMTLHDLAEKAMTGGASGVMRLAASPPQNQRAVREVNPAPEKLDHANARLHDQQ